MLKKVLGAVFLLYVVALHSSIAAMEMLSWSIFVLAVAGRNLQKKSLRPPLLWPMLGLVACVGMGLILNPPLKPFLSQFGFMRWVFLFWAFCWALEMLWDQTFEKKLINVWLAVSAVLAGYALVQFVTGLDLRLGHHVLEQEGHVFRSAGFFVNCLTFAYVMGASYFGISKKAFARLPRPWGLVFLATGFAAIITSMSRGALLAAILTVLGYLAVAQRKWLPYFLGASIAGVAALSLIWGKLGSLLKLTFDTSSNERVHLWKAYFNMFLDHPVFGVGLFQGDKLLPEYYARLGIQDQFYSHAHNILVQWLAGA